MSLTPSSGDRQPVLQISDLSCRIGSAQILEDISLTLKRGEVLGVVGESGSGKSMLMRCIVGIAPHSARLSGSVQVKGTEIVGASDRTMRDIWALKIAMVFQDPSSAFNPVVRMGRQLTEVMRLRLGLDAASASRKAIDLLRSTRISDPEARLNQYPHQLSGGIRQRMAIAMALAGNPEILIADEATTALDATVQQDILDMLGAIQSSRNMAMVLVSHDIQVVEGRADKVAVMYGGKLVEYGPTREVFGCTMHRYSEALIAATPRLDKPRHTRFETIAGNPPSLSNIPAGCRFEPRCAHSNSLCARSAPSPIHCADGHWHICHHPASGKDTHTSV